MICHALAVVLYRGHFDDRLKSHMEVAALLHKGDAVAEARIRPDIEQLPTHALFYQRLGRDCSIDDMLRGGNGFPGAQRQISRGQIADLHFDLACTQEKRDLRSLLHWQRDLASCLHDRERGRCDG